MLESNNLAKTWKAWKDEFQLSLDLTLTEASEETKQKPFFYLVRETGRELCETLNEMAKRYRFFMRDIFDKYESENH